VHCPYCDHPDVRVVDSRDAAEGIRRRRECHFCGQRFTTMEQVQAAALLVAKHDGRREPFSREKVRTGVQLACAKRPLSIEDVDGLVVGVERELERLGRAEVPSALIGELVMEQLRALDRVAYVRFASIYRNFQDIDSFAQEVESLRQATAVPASGGSTVQAQLPLPINGGASVARRRSKSRGPSRKTGGGGGSHTAHSGRRTRST